MNQIIDFTQDTSYDIVVNRNRTLKAVLHCQYLSGSTYVDFNFDEYDTVLMHVKQKPDSDNVLLALSSINNTLVMLPDGRLSFDVDNTTMNLRAGEYVYDIYLYSTDYAKRAFMSGKFIVNSTVTN